MVNDVKIFGFLFLTVGITHQYHTEPVRNGVAVVHITRRSVSHQGLILGLLERSIFIQTNSIHRNLDSCTPDEFLNELCRRSGK